MELPIEFETEMRELLGAEYDLFISSLDRPRHFGLRVNNLKISKMPKMKTNSGSKKRFTLTGTGKIKRKHAFHSHILTKKWILLY